MLDLGALSVACAGKIYSNFDAIHSVVSFSTV